ncbi:MAG: efflux RND transporter permease subunit [Candidatus Omnitrophica bacterium]|nr:efflux RND transporter permease subunit [Candidatus Omnitrophota bacterium]
MLKKIISYFVDRHLLTNLIFIIVIAGGIIGWQQIKKEEMPDVTFDFVRISANYPGATAEEVEHFVTKEIEEAVEGLDGVYRVTSSAAQGRTSVTVELQQNYPRRDEAITEIRNAVLDVKLPEDVRDDPTVRVFETSKKAIIDVVLKYTGTHLLSTKQRQLLQTYAIALENQLRHLSQVNSIDKSGYFQEEIQIDINPKKLIDYDIPLSQVRSEVTSNHARQPAGHIEVKDEPKVTINAQLDTPEKLKKLYIQAGFTGKAIPLEDIAKVDYGFKQEKGIIKVNGHEAVMLRVVKNTSYGILESLQAVKQVADRFRKTHLKDAPVDLTLLDDESIDLRNRLSIISQNGIFGFILILIMLFLFLNKRSGFWVAMGIPFTVCSTLIGAVMLGYTINNITLAAVIIVMGMVVDDAIVVAENVGRLRSQGMDSRNSTVLGTEQVFLPVVASIVTTCVAFIPLFYFSGRFGQINTFIPPIIFLMLGASLFESLIILPGHLHFKVFRFKKKIKPKELTKPKVRHWFEKVENWYGNFLKKLLPLKYFVFLGFILLLIGSFWIVKAKMKFVMFPHEETREIVFVGTASPDSDRIKTAEISQKIEQMLKPYIGKEVVGYRTGIAMSRRGGAVEENKFRVIVEIVPKEKRKKSANQLIQLWEPEAKKIEGLKELLVQKSRWGQASGSPIEILVQENNDQLRRQVAVRLAEAMEGNPALENVDIEEPIRIPEYKIDFKREKIKRLAISPANLTSTFRSALEGVILYEFPKGDQEVDVRLSVEAGAKTDIETILEIPVENKKGYLVPLGDLVTVTKTTTPNSIARRDGKRTTTVYGDIKPSSKLTPLEVAEYLESSIFIDLTNDYPSVALAFTGEVYDTRQSQGDFGKAVVLVLLIIFAILAILYNSLTRPLIIMLAIPFGLVGIVLAFLLHGKLVFGFFAAIGALGLAGVVINDSIIMLSKLDAEIKAEDKEKVNRLIPEIAKTRLRAVVLTTVTTVAGVLPTAYGILGYDTMLAEMMLALAWGLIFGTTITLILVPCIYSFVQDLGFKIKKIIE